MQVKPATTSKVQRLSILKNESVRRLGIGQFLAVAATYAIFFSSIAFVENRTRSSAQMGVMIMARTRGFTTGPLAESECPVDPVGVLTITPSPM